MRSNGIARWWPSNLSLSTTIVGLAVLGFAPLFGWALTRDSWFLLIFLVAVALAPAVARWPIFLTFGLYAFVATSLDAFPLLPGGASLSKPIGFLAGAVLLGAGLMERRLGRPPRATLWWGVFLLWAVLSVAWSIDPARGLARLPTAVSLVVLYLAAVSFRPSRRELYWVCALTVLGGVFAAGLAYTFGVNELATGGAARGRLALGDGDIETNPNTLGRILLLPLGLAIAGFVGWRGALQRALTVGCAGLIGLGIFISMSRGAIVAMTAMLVVLMYRMRARWQIVAVMVLLLIVSTTMPDAFYQRVGAAMSGEDDTGSGRTEIWKTALRAFDRSGLSRSGLVGVGLENFPEVYKNYAFTHRGAGAHNIYLQALIDLGVVGLALMLAAIASGLRAVRKARSAGQGGIVTDALEAVCIGALVSALFGDYLWIKSFWLAWILLAWSIHCERPSAADTGALIVRR